MEVKKKKTLADKKNADEWDLFAKKKTCYFGGGKGRMTSVGETELF